MVKHLALSLLAMSGGTLANAQVVTPTVVATSGAVFQNNALQLDNTIGEAVITTYHAPALLLDQGFQRSAPVRLALNLRALLQGPYDGATGTMRDALRSAGYLPLKEPYTALGLPQLGSGGEGTSAAVLAITGADAVVDWVHLQLRDASNNATVVSTRNALLQRDGDVVDIDGHSPVAFAAPAGPYFVLVAHRNHLAVLTAAAVNVGPVPSSIDLTDGSTPAHGVEALKMAGAVRLLWSGDANGDGLLKYTGNANDRDPMLITVGGTTPNNTVTGYRREDVDLDGVTKYTGADNDRDALLQNVGGSSPNNVRAAQVP